MIAIILVIVIIILAWTYDFWNGANDCANSIATTISTHALSFRRAIFLAALFNFLGAFITTEVAKTIGKGIVLPEIISQPLLIFTLIGAIIWVILSTHYGIPISVTHSLLGGLIGTALVSVGISALKLSGLIKVLIGMILAPIAGFFAGVVLILAFAWLIKFFFSKTSPSKINRAFRTGQVFTTIAVSLSHGMNDTQNAMGIITASLFAGGILAEFKVPFWVILGSGVFMALGTIWGGQRVIRTMGRKIYRVKPIHGISCEASSAAIIGIQSLFGIPLSTTQVISAGVMGVGAIERKSMVNWRKVIEIFFTWIFTIPGAAIISGILFLIFQILI
ncbi:MAG: inorganic phosphate transporter [Patescibacteria group bacterium]|nr:inorganic phosphate transporter [Patescibacteria group bacterium]